MLYREHVAGGSNYTVPRQRNPRRNRVNMEWIFLLELSFYLHDPRLFSYFCNQWYEKFFHLSTGNNKFLVDSKDDILLYTNTTTGLQCRCEVTTFTDFPAVEWVAYLKNTGKADTLNSENIQSLDIGFPVEICRMCWLHHSKGVEAGGGSAYAPLETQLHRMPNTVRLKNAGGRSSYGALPFFNLQMGEEGVIGAKRSGLFASCCSSGKRTGFVTTICCGG